LALDAVEAAVVADQHAALTDSAQVADIANTVVGASDLVVAVKDTKNMLAPSMLRPGSLRTIR